MNKTIQSEVFEIKEKIGTIIIINLVLLSILSMGWNLGGVASNNEDDSNNPIDQNSEPRSGSNGGYNWSQIEVLSEIVSGQDINTVWSSEPQIAVENDKIYVV